jgi:hypothetical protein
MDRDTIHTIPITQFMRDNNLSSEDVMLILKRHVNDLQFEKEISDIYEENSWDDWSEGDIV